MKNGGKKKSVAFIILVSVCAKMAVKINLHYLSF